MGCWKGSGGEAWAAGIKRQPRGGVGLRKVGNHPKLSTNISDLWVGSVGEGRGVGKKKKMMMMRWLTIVDVSGRRMTWVL